MILYRHIQHGSCVALLLAIIYGNYVLQADNGTLNFDPYKRYGRILTWIMNFSRICSYCAVLFAFVNCLGIICFNTFPEKPFMKHSPFLAPFICFRVVTRGMFPDLVKNNISRNLELISKVGLRNFMFEVVTDKAIGLNDNHFVRELVVPHNYSTRQGSLFKARALQYCLEPEINLLSDEDWIVHLDEETVLTEDSIIGTVNFIAEGKYQFGQGVIVYAKDKIVNWITTLADSVRVGIDYGQIRFCLKVLHKPFFSWKGSFIVANVAAEKDVSFDHGPEASIAEDSFFAMMAQNRGYVFGFVEGEMRELSTFTLMDFIRQRRRWLSGILMTACSSKIPPRYKVGLVFMCVSGLLLPFITVGFVLGILFPLPPWGRIHAVIGSILGTFVFLFIFGTIKSFNVRRTGIAGFIFLVFVTVICSVICMFLETVAALWACVSRGRIPFHVVEKQIPRRSVV